MLEDADRRSCGGTRAHRLPAASQLSKPTRIRVTDVAVNDDTKALKSLLVLTFFDNLDSDGSKTFSRHLRGLLLDLDESTRDDCAARLGEVRQATTTLEKDRLIDSLTAGDSSRHVLVENSLSVLSFLVDAFLSDKIPRDDHRNWSADLARIGWLDTQSQPAFDSLLDKLANTYLPELQAQDRRRRAEGGVLPVFKSLGITVEARAVRKDRYKWGMPLEGEEGYRPEILGTAMIASVHIGVDAGPSKDFYCQMNESDIDNLIASLVAAKKEMAALREYLNLDASGKAATHG